MFSCSDVKMAFCLAIINSVAAITLKTMNDARAEFFGKHILKMKMVRISEGDLKMTFNLQHGKVLSIAFCSRFLISNGFLPRKSLDSHYYLGINNSKIVNHFHFKNVLPKKLCCDIVYSFKCNSCNAIYYGKTNTIFMS